MAAEKYNIIALPPKALLFDVFGTVVNWRASLTAMLATTAATRLQNGNLSSEMRDHIATFDDQTWGQFAENWRDSYLEFAHNFKPETQQFRNVDYHWRQSLQELFIRYKLEGFFTDTETENLVNCWHSLEPWLDSSVGLQMLGSKMITCTLSDGPRAVLRDLDTFGNLHFREFLSSEDFQAYKPHPSVYLGAAKRLGLEPHECCMVAAHLRDLDGKYTSILLNKPNPR
jgi:2-haloacid dehalogenase